LTGKLIIIGGYLASGKSTFARQLSEALQIPYLIKDTLKIALCSSVAVTTREESSRFSAVTFDAMLYVAERHMEVGAPLILEGNFLPAGFKPVDEAEAIKTLLDRYGCRPLTYQFTGDTRVLHERYVERDKLPERGDVNRMQSEISYETFDGFCHNLDGFDVGGEVVSVDTTDFSQVDFAGLIERARCFYAS
jgi:predicted kinase